MNRKLATTAAARGDWFDRIDALAAGYTDHDIQTRIRAGRWASLCRGAYAELPAEPLSEWDQARWLHLRAAKAVYHHSAAVRF